MDDFFEKMEDHMPKRSILRKSLVTATIMSSVATLAQADEVTVGVLVPLTGELGEFGEIVANAVELGVAEVNAAGGTSCGTLRTVVADTGGNPEVGIREATRMIESEGAVAVLGPTSGVMVALVDMAKRTETVVISPYAGTITLNELGGDFVYRTVSSDLGDGAASGLWAHRAWLQERRLPCAERGIDHITCPGRTHQA